MRRATVLMAWELGGGYGHLAKLRLIGDRLAEAGVGVAYAARELATGDALVPREKAPVFQSPVFQGVRVDAPRPRSYADLLIDRGYGQAATLHALVRGWVALLEATRADLVMADFAPTALLAARCLGIPAVCVGHGFFDPPRPWPTIVPEQAGEAQAPPQVTVRRHLGAQINHCLAQWGRPALHDPCALHEVAASFLCTYPELDHYVRDGGHYVGTLCVETMGEPPLWPQATGAQRVFAYLSPRDDRTPALLQALSDSKASCLVHGAAEARDRHPDPAVRHVDHLVRLADVAAQADLVICSGSDTAHGMALRGVPVLCVPNHLEQQMGAQRLVDLGIGLVAARCDDARTLSLKLHQLLQEARHKEAARRLQARHPAHDNSRTVNLIAEGCLALLRH